MKNNNTWAILRRVQVLDLNRSAKIRLPVSTVESGIFIQHCTNLAKENNLYNLNRKEINEILLIHVFLNENSIVHCSYILK